MVCTPGRSTTSGSSYKLDGDAERARRRLSLIEKRDDPLTIDCLERIGVHEGWRCLEVGAGGGSIATWLSERVRPCGLVVATDIETRFLEPLRSANLEVRRHDASREDLEEEAFDLVHARHVLAHVPEREAALRKMAAAVRPGGWILSEEPDVTTEGPDPAAPEPVRALCERVKRAILGFLRQQGIDPFFGARVLGLLGRLDFDSLGSEGSVRSYVGGPGQEPSPHMLAFADLEEAIIAGGWCGREEFDEFLALPGDESFIWRDALTVAAWGRRRGSIAP